MSELVQHFVDSILDLQREALLSGDRPTMESLLAGSRCEDDPEALLDLLYNEIVVLEELGEQPTIDDYVHRYPQLEDELRLHFEIHRAINENLFAATSQPQRGDTWTDRDEETFVPGTTLGEYTLVEQIGRGGIGIVFRARDRRLHRDVAIKLLQPSRQPTSREILRFQTEAEAMARLSHPNIVQIYEVGRHDGRAFLALELAERGTLVQQLHQTLLTPRAASRLIETLARAVDHAHKQHVVHRDLKPANILFTRDGTPKITDFGLAKVLQNESSSPRDATRTGEPIGTPRYMSPEQASGQHNQISPATDIYALGTLLYECLTGRAPFIATSVIDTMQMILTDDPVSPRRLQPSVPRDVATICLRCLEKDPRRRYPTAAALADDLQRFQNGEPIHARPTSEWERGVKWCRRRPAHAALIGLAMLFSFSALAMTIFAQHAEAQRVQQLRRDVAVLVSDGRMLLDQDEVELAFGRFHAAWKTVQGEPALADHLTSIGGWLDHSHRAINQQQWQQRVPPREYDERRDVAFLESLLLEGALLEPATPSNESAVELGSIPATESANAPLISNAKPIAAARDSIAMALELTIAGDRAWQSERERLVLVEADLIAIESSAEEALAYLDSTHEFSSRLFHERRASLPTQLKRPDEAEHSKQLAAEHPRDKPNTLLLNGMSCLRQRDFIGALTGLEQLLYAEPEHYTARLFHAVCCLHLKRPAEARVALTACIAQRPRLFWNPFFRSQASLALGDLPLATHDLQHVLEMKTPDHIRRVVEAQLKTIALPSTPSRSVDPSTNQ